jgi:hypothetical protein
MCDIFGSHCFNYEEWDAMLCSLVEGSSRLLQMLVNFYQITALQIHIPEGSILHHSLCIFYYIYPNMRLNNLKTYLIITHKVKFVLCK